MKRFLIIPAVVCLIAFALLYAVFERALGDEDRFAASYVTKSSREFPSEPPSPPASEAQRMLEGLEQRYQEQRRAWEESPHRIFSRARISPVYPARIEYVLAPQSEHADHLVLATVSVHHRDLTEIIPCAIDPAANRIFLYYDEAWCTDGQWLDAMAPLPAQDRKRLRGEIGLVLSASLERSSVRPGVDRQRNP